MSTKTPRLNQKRKLEEFISEPELQKKRVKDADITASALAGQGFVVELFLDEQQQLHSSQVLDVKSGEGDKWAGWDAARLLAFITKRAGISAAQPRQTAAPAKTTTSGFALREMTIQHQNDEAATRLLRSGAPLLLELSLLRPGTSAPQAMNYQAYLSAERAEDRGRFAVAAEQGVLQEGAEKIIVPLPALTLPPGTYHFQATVFLAAAKAPQSDYACLSRVYQVY